MLIIFVFVKYSNNCKGLYMSSEIQKERTRKVFIESAKSILTSEGLGAATARNIAAKAGFSYATLYQYFKDTRNLLFVCAKEFLEECAEFVQSNSKRELKENDALLDLSLLFFKYFIQYPGIYELLFVENSVEFAGANSISDEIEATYSKIFDGTINRFKNNENLRIAHQAVIIGIMHMYLNRRAPKDYKTVLENYKTAITLIMTNASTGSAS